MLNHDETNYEEMAKIMTTAAEEVCGRSVKEVDNPWNVGHEEEIERRQANISELVERRNWIDQVRITRANERRMEEEREVIRERLKDERKELKQRLRTWEREWWQRIIDECRDAQQTGDIGKLYKALRKLERRGQRGAPSGSNITTDEFREHFAKITETRHETEARVVDEVVEQVRDLTEQEEAREANDLMNEEPEDEEIREAMKKTKESAPGKEGVRKCFISCASREVQEEVIRTVKWMFNKRANKWEETLKTGQMVPLFKKGDRNCKDNYRGICLLSMGSRILARVMASRLRWWSEHLGLVDENQCGFRPGRSTADATQIMVRIQEDAVDLRRRRMQAAAAEGTDDNNNVEERGDPEARLLDLRKAYPRVNKPILWKILQKSGLRGKCLETLEDLHETTSYVIKGKEKDSDPWMPERGLREGCPTSPALFNIYHQAVMRQAEASRKAHNEERERQTGVTWKWVRGSCFPSINLWEKHNSEAEEVAITSALFADDTTIVGTAEELEEGVQEIKRVMGKFEERNNDAKEERLKFGTEEAGEIRILGCWMGPKEDLRNRKRRAGAVWGKVKRQLKGSKLSKRVQVHIYEACVEGALLFDCSTRTWFKKDLKELQSWVDRGYRYIWSNKTGPTLMQMQRMHRNMQDVRNTLNVRSIRWKVEKRVLERIGHVMRMSNERTTKAAVLGWLGELEGYRKCPGRKRKTVLYWKGVLKDAGMDWTDIERLTADRDEWRRRVKKRMDHVEQWERQGGHEFDELPAEERVERSEVVDEQDPLRCKWPGCEKLCKSKGGLAIHRKRMHGVTKEDRKFECPKCAEAFKTEANMCNHTKTCRGERTEREDMRRCERCGREVSKSNIARHRRACAVGEAEGGARGQARPEVEVAARRYRAQQKPCPQCDKMLSATNMARHLKTCRGRIP